MDRHEEAAAAAELVERAQRDPAFRERLLADPAATVFEQFGVKVPEGLTVRVVEEQPGEVVLVLPPRPPAGALPEQDLAALAGGDCKFGTMYTWVGQLAMCRVTIDCPASSINVCPP